MDDKQVYGLFTIETQVIFHLNDLLTIIVPFISLGNVPSNQSVSITPGMNTQAVGSIQQQQSQDDSMQLASDDETTSTAGITTVINYNHQNKSRDDNSQSERSNPHMNRPQGAGWPLDKATRKASRAASRDKLLKLTGYQTKAILSDIK